MRVRVGVCVSEVPALNARAGTATCAHPSPVQAFTLQMSQVHSGNACADVHYDYMR